ncbi:TIGR02281 family clan AA aspartic protease [Altererythrobacter sp.]|nr:TIGR02281 family clan AA aspartic protease [Altererythrobacter sp.]
MIGRTLLLALGISAMAAAFVPSLPNTPISQPDAPGTAKPAPQQIALNAASEATADWYAGSHTLQRQSDGHFYADARISGTSTRMMVDTGASVIALTGEDAAAAGLRWDPARIAPVGTGASGTVYGLNAMLDEVEIGGIVRRNVRAVIIPEGLAVSLLGQSYLAQIKSVEIADDKMVLAAQ